MKYIRIFVVEGEGLTHLVRGSISAWDCKHFIEEKDETHEDLQCKKGYDVCEGRKCPDFREK